MRVNRRLLYWGVFFVAIGGVLVASNLRGIDASTIADALRLWPLAIIAIGVGLVLRRTQFSLPGGMLAAAVPGLVLGGVFAVTPNLAAFCRDDQEPTTVATSQGTFDGPARISLTASCGLVNVGTAPGSNWELQAGNSPNRMPTISASARTLSIDAGGGDTWHRFDAGIDTWRLTLPTTAIDDLSIEVNAGEGRINLPGAQIGRLEVTTNAGQTTVDLSEASVARLAGEVNAGQLTFRLPAAADVIGTLDVNAGELQVCVPAGIGLRVRHDGALSGISINGLQQSGTDWQSQDYASADHRADLTVDVNLGNVKINPIGGCK
jgi:Domain of unknown function (DUF5668)